MEFSSSSYVLLGHMYFYHSCGMENKVLALNSFLLALENSSHCSLLLLLKLTGKADVIFIRMLVRVGFINTFPEMEKAKIIWKNKRVLYYYSVPKRHENDLLKAINV